MQYQTDYRDAARRHWDNAEHLRAGKAFDTAAYHYGFSAECGIKAIIVTTLPIPKDLKKHFSANQTYDFRLIALTKLQGRQMLPLRNLLSQRAYFADWEVYMRYAPTGTILEHQCETWRSDANETFLAVGIKR